MILGEVGPNGVRLLALLNALEDTDINVGADAVRSVNSCRDEQASRSRKTVPHQTAWTGENLIGHEEGQLGARGRGSQVFPLL